MNVEHATPIITQRTVRRPKPGQPGILTRAPFVAVDVETTGTADVARVIEIAAVRFAADGTAMDRFSSLANPGRHVPLNPAAQRVHGITPEQVWSAPPLATVLAEFRTFVGSSGLVAHNLAFENRFLTAEYQRLGETAPTWQGVCTLATARKQFRMPSNKLVHLIDEFDLPAVNSHRALDDAHACGLLLAAMMQRRNLTDLEPLDTLPPAAASVPREQITVAGPPALDPPPPTNEQTKAAFGGHMPTDEQAHIVDVFQQGQQLTVSACAGSGKTSTVLGLARLEASRRPRRRGLYLAFNASVAREAKSRFPQSVEASTAHALAFRHLKTGPHAALLGKLNAPRPRWRDTIDALGATKLWLPTGGAGPRVLSEYVMTRLALRTLEQFCRTTDEGIGPHHVPDQVGVDGLARDQMIEQVLPLARRAWRLVLDPQRFEVQFQHDHYLKMWADTAPRVGRDGDYLIVDEAQDLNPILREIVLAQSHLQRVMVGDSAQAIYGFTGARDALHDVPDAVERSLTQSWRFGDTIAAAANTYLQQLGETMRVRGNPAKQSRLITTDQPVDAVLCRTNADAIAEVIAAQKAGKATALEGDRAAALRFCDSAEQLQAGISPKDPSLAAFSTWSDLTEYVENSPGVSELKTLVELVDDHGLDVVRDAMENLVPRSRAALIASTAHKAKGLEFPRVRINGNWQIETPMPGVDEDEHNAELMLAYVGLTRAMDALDPGQLLTEQDVARIQPDTPGAPTTDGGLFDLPLTG
ncbi:exonuclease domain-containing protein [Dietzia sp. 179-F 9C3 NHS]|uniref:exonuclease domain-containing protein n=1 Tax=Dietzia sp. 179-F 9C3 NHS TaxID=3374295 RepID=UPI00387A6887